LFFADRVFFGKEMTQFMSFAACAKQGFKVPNIVTQIGRNAFDVVVNWKQFPFQNQLVQLVFLHFMSAWD